MTYSEQPVDEYWQSEHENHESSLHQDREAEYWEWVMEQPVKKVAT